MAKDLLQIKWILSVFCLTILVRIASLNFEQRFKVGSNNGSWEPDRCLKRPNFDKPVIGVIRGEHLQAEPSTSSMFGILFAEAGKKKKKEKSEVVVISVNNPQSRGHGEMYPIFIPSCGGHGGYGRRKRSIGSIARKGLI